LALLEICDVVEAARAPLCCLVLGGRKASASSENFVQGVLLEVDCSGAKIAGAEGGGDGRE
jgi:hypothetical protein